jgi:hypothetical protein
MRRRYRNEITDGCELYFLITLSFRDVEELMLERHCPVVNADTEITTPKPEVVTARCTGTGENLVVDISAPHGRKIKAANPLKFLQSKTPSRTCQETSTQQTSSSKPCTRSTGRTLTRSTSRPPLIHRPTGTRPTGKDVSICPCTSTAPDRWGLDN